MMITRSAGPAFTDARRIGSEEVPHVSATTKPLPSDRIARLPRVTESRGCEAVHRVAREQHPAWLGVIRACRDAIEQQVAGGGVDHTCAVWIKNQTGVQVSSLRPLVNWGVLEHKRWGVVDGVDLDESGRIYYLMPDRPGVARALAELGA